MASDTPDAQGTTTTFDTDVLIVGAGPTGLTLATALAARNVKSILIDSQAEAASTSRAAVVHARTLEVLEPLGVTAPLIEHGVEALRFVVRDRDRVLATVSFDDLPTRFPFALLISQATTEATLLERLRALGGDVSRSRTLEQLTQDTEGVRATLQDGSTIRARYAVGADGQQSKVRACCDIGYTGGDYEENFVLADARLRGDVPRGEGVLYLARRGILVLVPLPGGSHRVIATVADAPEQPSAPDLQALLDERGPERERALVEEVIWSSRFRIHHRLADVFARGRVALAGDAAHVHSPAGGQGMNTGIQDAVVLAEALQRALRGDATALAEYSDTRRPIAKHVVKLTDRMVRTAMVNPRLRPARNFVLKTLAAVPRFRRKVALELSELTLH